MRMSTHTLAAHASKCASCHCYHGKRKHATDLWALCTLACRGGRVEDAVRHAQSSLAALQGQLPSPWSDTLRVGFRRVELPFWRPAANVGLGGVRRLRARTR